MDSNQIAARIEEISGQPLEEDQRLEIQIWQRGRVLASIPPHAREEIEGMLEGYVRTDADSLIAQDPADTAAVLSKHAQAHASARLLVRFTSDFELAVNSSKTPDIVKHSLRNFSQMPPESM